MEDKDREHYIAFSWGKPRCLKECLSRRLVRLRRFPILPVIIIGGFILISILAPYISPSSPLTCQLSDRLQPPSWANGPPGHFLGTDLVGRDVLSRLFYGARISLLVGVVSMCISTFVGSLAGLISGYRGGWIDTIIMRAVDMCFSFPMIIVALLLAVAFGPSFQNVVIVIFIIYWARFARLTRSQVLSVKQMDFVAFAHTCGCSALTIITRHILVNVLNTIVIYMAMNVGFVMIVEASLSFLGVGIPAPTPSWGNMIAGSRAYIPEAWWLYLPPGIALSLLVLAFNFFGDWLRNYIDPTLRKA